MKITISPSLTIEMSPSKKKIISKLSPSSLIPKSKQISSSSAHSSENLPSSNLENSQKKMTNAVQSLLSALGEDPDREGLVKTPERVAKSFAFLTQGYGIDPQEVINKAIFHEKYDEMVIVKDIQLYSLCEHHLLPFYGVAHVAYLPDHKIVGLSKIARLVDIYARRLQVQERMTQEIADTLQKTLKPKGVAVVIEAQHLCMQMRGVQKQGSSMVTSAMHGYFKSNSATRAEFFSLIRNEK